VVAVHINDPALAARAWHGLLQMGVYVNLALPPATPSGTALLRCSVCAAHSTEQLRRVIDVMSKVGLEFGLIADQSVRIAAAE
jgi:8-amino-7-oxononanoate synthase